MVVVPYKKVSFVQILTSNIMLTCHIGIVKKDASLNTRYLKSVSMLIVLSTAH